MFNLENWEVVAEISSEGRERILKANSNRVNKLFLNVSNRLRLQAEKKC